MWSIREICRAKLIKNYDHVRVYETDDENPKHIQLIPIGDPLPIGTIGKIKCVKMSNGLEYLFFVPNNPMGEYCQDCNGVGYFKNKGDDIKHICQYCRGECFIYNKEFVKNEMAQKPFSFLSSEQ